MNNKIIIGCLMLLVSTYWSCRDMDSTYKEFLVPGGLTYVGKPTGVKAYTGNYRILLKWAKNPDPKVTKTRVYWNNYRDSIEVASTGAEDSLSVIIDGLNEQNYSFFLRSFDESGHVSIPVEINTRVFGDQYAQSVLNRGLNRATLDAEGIVTLDWGLANVSSGALKTEVSYTDQSGTKRILTFPAGENSSEIPEFSTAELARFRTIYVPDSFAIDTFYTGFDTVNQILFDKSGWEISDFSSQHGGNENGVINFIDGTDATRWHGLVGGPAYPHHATIDMGVEQKIARFGVWRTTFDTGGDDRAPDRIQFLVSNDNENWTDLGSYDFDRFVNGEQVYTVDDAPSARYFRFVGLSGPEEYMVMGEIDVYVR